MLRIRKGTSFLTYFTSGYGICWLVLLIIALLSQSHINTGEFGIYGFPLLALFYALIRRSTSTLNGSQVRGGKNQVTQNGIRVPLIANWPGKIAPGTNSDLVDASGNPVKK